MNNKITINFITHRSRRIKDSIILVINSPIVGYSLVTVTDSFNADGAPILLTYLSANSPWHATHIVSSLLPCTTCGYCQPCPSGVDIPNVLSLLNATAMFDSKEGPSAVYRQWVLAARAGADQCTECHDCEPRCPQHIAIPERLAEAHTHLTT